MYIDDFLMERSLLRAFKEKCADLNVQLNLKKETEGNVVVYQGTVVDLVKKRFRVTKAMVQKIRSFSPSFRDDNGRDMYSMANLEKLCGRLEWCSWLIGSGRQRMFHLLTELQAARDENTIFLAFSEDAYGEFEWWKKDEVLLPGRSFSDCDSSTLVQFDTQGSSDATPARYGLRLYSTKFPSFLKAKSGLVPKINTLLSSLQKKPLKMETPENSIGYSELYAVYRAILEAPEGGRILLRVDNKGVVCGVFKGRFRSLEI